jgi:hypothetical protein
MVMGIQLALPPNAAYLMDCGIFDKQMLSKVRLDCKRDRVPDLLRTILVLKATNAGVAGTLIPR